MTMKTETQYNWQPPETAPRDGTAILGDFGLPWACYAVWDECYEWWVYASVTANRSKDGKVSADIETERDTHPRLRRWMPVQELPADGSSFVFLDDASRPYLVFRGWINYRHSDNQWVTLRELKPGERETLEALKLPDDQAALYGWPCVANDKDVLSAPAADGVTTTPNVPAGDD